ncbi:hypothetical protein DFH07DRAFT_261788 [Mycena maculata]|uniref:F-box domain-containing protein n=1 Tax=Mycena maculata TaxID=230809 RepID=A0AAD7HQ59_9AGAR|nr:hypothetical protein DFH07DRAFT_261788 [Mycena maculata]
MESPFKDILYTNIAPSDSQCQTIRGFLVAPREEISALTDEIVSTQALLEALTQRRAALEELVSAHLALVSPIRRLPADVIQEIFVACLPSGQNSVMSEQDAPLLLCHICRAWRSLAFCMPRLWAALHVAVPSKDDMPAMNEAVNGWLSRSGILPLSISVGAPRRFEYDVSTLLQTLISFSPRWKHIRFMFPIYDSFSPLASLSPADVPILKTLALKGFHWNASTPDPGTLSNHLGFIGTASLRSVSIPAGAPDSTLIPFRWEHLRQLSFRGGAAFIAADVALTILQKCPLLEMLSFSLRAGNVSPAPATLCHMEYLRDLYVFERVPQTSDFFAHIIAPNLAHLEYASLGSDLPFTPMLSSSRFLDGLCLKGSRVPVTSLLDTLALIPTIRRLLLRNEPVILPARTQDPLFISLLNRGTPEAAGILCPNLERIELVNFHAMSDKTLLEFVQARPRLSNVRVRFHRVREIDIIPPLQPVIDEGLEVSLHYQDRARRLRMRVYSPSEALERHDADWMPSPPSDFWS